MAFNKLRLDLQFIVMMQPSYISYIVKAVHYDMGILIITI